MYRAFAHPWFLGSLSLLAGLGLCAWRGRRWRRLALSELGGKLNHAPGGRARRWLRHGCLLFGLTLLCVGAAGPQSGRDWEQAASPGRDVVIVLDRSRSMLAEKPSRLERTRKALLEMAAFLKRQGSGHRLALVTFAAQPRLVCPLTHDYDHFRETVAAIDPNSMDVDLEAAGGAASGTRIGAALQLAVQASSRRSNSEAPREACDILLLSDGDDPAHDGEWRDGI